MTLLEVVTAAGERTNKPTSNSVVKTRFINHVNFARQKAWQKYNWSWKQKVWSFSLLDQITTGTANVTNGSRTVTLASATVSSTHIGWYFNAIASDPDSWYRVVNVSGSTLTLETPYQGTTNPVTTFYLRGFDWLIPSELEGMPTLVELGTQHLSINSQFQVPSLIPDTRGKPTHGIFWSNDPIGSTYTTGTITATDGSRSWSGSGTTWLGNVVPGDELQIVIGSMTYKYTVHSVQSDTVLTTYQFPQTTHSDTTYLIRNQFKRFVRLSPTPDRPYPMAVHGQRRWYPLNQDDDTDEFLTFYPESLVEAIEAYEAASTPDDRENDKYNRWLFSLAEKIGIDGRNWNVTNPAPISLPYGAYRA